MSPGGPDVTVYTQPGGRNDVSQPGVLTGNGSVLIGSKGILATSNRGEGVSLLPAARSQDYEWARRLTRAGTQVPNPYGVLHVRPQGRVSGHPQRSASWRTHGRRGS